MGSHRLVCRRPVCRRNRASSSISSTARLTGRVLGGGFSVGVGVGTLGFGEAFSGWKIGLGFALRGVRRPIEITLGVSRRYPF